MFPVKTAVQCVNCIVKVRFKLQRTIKCGMESVPECKVVDCGRPCTYAIIQTTERPDLLKIDPTVAHA